MSKCPSIEQLITWVYTHDLEATCEFYAAKLGFEQIRDGGAARIFRVSKSGLVGVCEAIDWRVVEPNGSMITVVTDDVDGWYRRLRDAGVACRGRPKNIEAFGIYAFVLEDPNGYLIEFQQFLK